MSSIVERVRLLEDGVAGSRRVDIAHRQFLHRAEDSAMAFRRLRSTALPFGLVSQITTGIG
jgi:hypothetical protein